MNVNNVLQIAINILRFIISFIVGINIYLYTFRYIKMKNEGGSFASTN